MAWDICESTTPRTELAMRLTYVINELFAARQLERVHSQFAADGATKLRWNFILGEGAASLVSVKSVAKHTENMRT